MAGWSHPSSTHDEDVLQFVIVCVGAPDQCADTKLGFGFLEPEHGVLLVNIVESKTILFELLEQTPWYVWQQILNSVY